MTASGGGRWRRWSHSARAVASGGGGLTVQGRWRSTVAVWLWRGSERRREIRAGGRRWGVAAATAISAMVVAPWREADKRLEMVPGNRVSHERQRFIPPKFQEPPRIKHRELAPLRLPPPLQVPPIRPPILHTILMRLNAVASLVRVIRRLRVRNPFPGEDITLLRSRRRPETIAAALSSDSLGCSEISGGGGAACGDVERAMRR
nr:hypothetical protein GW17_00050212 [Ipomoea batatas]